MPTKHARLALTVDPELEDAIRRGTRVLGPDKPRAAIAREMILRGSEALGDAASDLDRYLDARGAIRATKSTEELLALGRELRRSIPPDGPSSAEILDDLRSDRV